MSLELLKVTVARSTDATAGWRRSAAPLGDGVGGAASATLVGEESERSFLGGLAAACLLSVHTSARATFAYGRVWSVLS